MIITDFPTRPWQKVGADLFHWNDNEYLLVIDYFSRYIEISKLGKSYTSVAVIERVK